MKSDLQAEITSSATEASIIESAHPLTFSGTIGARFAEIADRFADKTAIQCLEGNLTYGELNARVNRLAHALLKILPESPTRVALLFQQGINPLVSLLAVLKTGHAFVPLDAANPASRLQTILEDCEPGALITDTAHASIANELCGDKFPVLKADQISPDFPADNPNVNVSPESLAYIFYTSGSTGRPKGVCQNHRNILNYIGCYCDTLSITGQDRFSLLYTLSFSASNMDVFGSLLHGATLCPYNLRQRGSADLASWLDENDITILHAVPTVFRHLLHNLKSAQRFSSVRVIDLGGEAVYPNDVELYRNHFHEHCLFLNRLASTEFCMIAQYAVDRRANYACEMLPVGQPAAGSFIRILREDGTEAGVSEIGEMVVHSPFLSPGYWRRPDLNNQAFGNDPERKGWRTYTSGDLGSINSDGELCFLGRKDFRVKIRGISIDTSEVEAGLQDCPWVRSVAVTAKEDDQEEGSRRLVAFLETDDDQSLSHAQRLQRLRAFLQDRLPAYMIPPEFVFVDALPRTTSGKLDRKALAQLERPAIPEDQDDGIDELDAKTDELTLNVRQLFQEILRQKNVGVADDFFLLGGDSLKATHLHLELENSLGIRIPLEKLFAKPTVGGIADFLREWERTSQPTDSQTHSVVVPLRTTGDQPNLFLTHGAKGQAFVSPHFLNLIGEDQPVYAFQAMGLDRSRMPHNTIEEMAAEYVRAVREVQPAGPYFLGSICVGAVVTLEMASQLTEAGETVGAVLLIDPPVTPPGHHGWWKRFKRQLRAKWKRKFFKPTDKHKLVRKLREKKRKGTNRVDVDNADVMTKIAHTTYDFELALLKHRLKPYHGLALILRSSERQAKHEKRRHRPDDLKYPLKGEVKVWEVEGKHNQMLDVNNQEFGGQLKKCMEVAWKVFASLNS